MKPFSTCMISLAFTLAIPAQSQTLFSDSFESEDLSAAHTDGLNWSGTNRTSLVTRDPDQGDMVVFNGNPVEILVGFERDWAAIDGDISLKFGYPAGEYQSEQRFSFDTAYPDLWISFWLKVPINFKHSSNSPSNNKLFALWMDDYSHKGDGPTAFWTFWHDGAGGSDLAYHYSPGGHTTANAPKERTSFIRYPEDQGRWMQIVMHVKAATSSSSKDGVMQFYRRWADESSFTLIHDDQAADIAAPAGGPPGWKAGYLMGWSNPGYEEDTEWLLDDFVVSLSSLVDDAAPVDPPSPTDPPTGPEDPAEPEDPEECKPPQIPTIVGASSS